MIADFLFKFTANPPKLIYYLYTCMTDGRGIFARRAHPRQSDRLPVQRGGTRRAAPSLPRVELNGFALLALAYMILCIRLST